MCGQASVRHRRDATNIAAGLVDDRFQCLRPEHSELDVLRGLGVLEGTGAERISRHCPHGKHERYMKSDTCHDNLFRTIRDMSKN